MGGDPRKHKQRWRCSFYEEKGHKPEKYQALKVFLDQLVLDGHMKEFVDEKKTQVEKAEVKPNSSFACGDDETDKTKEDEEDILLGTIYMIGAQTTKILRIKFGKRSE